MVQCLENLAHVCKFIGANPGKGPKLLYLMLSDEWVIKSMKLRYFSEGKLIIRW